MRQPRLRIHITSPAGMVLAKTWLWHDALLLAKAMVDDAGKGLGSYTKLTVSEPNARLPLDPVTVVYEPESQQ